MHNSRKSYDDVRVHYKHYKVVEVKMCFYRSTEGIYFDAIMQELFDALREMELTELADFLDNQVTDVAFAKR